MNERKDIKERLKLMEFCIESIPDAVYWLALDGRFQNVNAAACGMLGYSRDELLSLSVNEIDPDYSHERLQSDLVLLKRAGTLSLRRFHSAKDGRIVPVEITSNYFTYKDAEYICCIVRDITERKQAEEALLFSQLSIDKAGIGIYHSDEKGAINYVNEYACASLGYTKEELLAKRIYDIDPAITREKMLDLKKILDVSGAVTHETVHRRKDGTTVPVEITANQLKFKGKPYVISFVKDITERKRVEEERQTSEESFSIIFQATPDMIAITLASDGTILEVNEAFSRLLGYSRAEAIGKCTEELSIWADPLDRARWIASLEATGQVDEFETTLRCRDGSLVTCVSTARPLDFGGEKCVLSVVRDITERKAAESALRSSQFIIDNASVGIMRGDADARILSVNEHWARVLGYSQEELCTMSFFDIDPNLAPESWLEHRKRLTATGFNTFESVQRRKDGTMLPVEVTVNYLKYGGDIFSCSFIRDITERKRAEEALRKSRQMLISVLDNFPGVVFWKDRNSVYLGCNRNFPLAAGLSDPLEIVGRSDHELPWKNDAEWYLADDRQVMESGVPKLNIIEPLLHADGRVAWFETSKVPLFDAEGKVFAVLGASNDITERKQAEEALRKAYDELEARVRERTEELTSLTAELSLAEERERRRIATELHDQVGQTLVFSKLKLNSLTQRLPYAEFETLLSEIRGHIGRSIEDIRSLTFQLSPPLLYEVGLEAALEWLGEELEEKYGFQVEFHDDGRKKPLDEEASVALYQMVRELLLNVAKHAKAKMVRISVEQVSDKIKISVADDGSGFDALNGLPRKNKNSGFGLFNIRQRIEYLGGGFEIESEIKQGTCVTLVLPVKANKISTNREKP
jgi:PAS domain S-box-containing protein